MTLLYSDPRFQEHITGAHPEHPRRLAAIERYLDESGLRGRCSQPAWQPATTARIARVHSKEYISQVKQYAAGGGGRMEADTVLSEKSYDVACLAAGAVCDAVARVTRGEDTT